MSKTPLQSSPSSLTLILPNEPGENLSDLCLGEQFQNFIKNKKRVKLERAFPPTVSQVGALLDTKTAMSTVLHFMSHCGHDRGTRVLIFEHGETGKLEYINASQLVSVLKKKMWRSRFCLLVSAAFGMYTIGSDCTTSPPSLSLSSTNSWLSALQSRCISLSDQRWHPSIYLLSGLNVK